MKMCRYFCLHCGKFRFTTLKKVDKSMLKHGLFQCKKCEKRFKKWKKNTKKQFSKDEWKSSKEQDDDSIVIDFGDI